MDPTLSEIRLFGGNYAPVSWMLCQGQALSIAENTALFALMGTTYGGDGQNTFKLPDFRGRVAVGTGTGPGLPPVDLGDVWGTESYTLSSLQLPAHNHILLATGGSGALTGTISATMNVNTASGGGSSPSTSVLGVEGSGSGLYAATTDDTTLNSSAIQFNTSQLAVNLSGTVQIAAAGQSQPVNNMQPFLALNYIIAVEGIFPSRN